MAFQINPTLENDSHKIGDTSLCELRLIDHQHVPWFLLVPKIENISEIYQLSQSDQRQLIQESSVVGEKAMSFYKGDKLNLGTIGHAVPQLHVHHVVRYFDDHQWPKVFWSILAELDRYPATLREQRIEEAQALFTDILVSKI